MRKLIALCTLALAGAILPGCAAGPTTVPVAPVVSASIQTLACAWGVYAADTAKTPPSGWVQIALDLASSCGMDVADIINAFGASHPVALAAQASASQIHTAAMKAQSVKAGGQ